jgi:DNA-binding MarR family transcriptional regulator
VNLARQGVTLRQFSILVALVRANPPAAPGGKRGAAQAGQLKVSELARALHVSLPAITQMVDQLEKKRLVKRLPHSRDRRVRLIALTQGGARLAAGTQGKALKLLTGIFLEFPQRDRDAIGSFMHSMSEKLGKAIEESK